MSDVGYEMLLMGLQSAVLEAGIGADETKRPKITQELERAFAAISAWLRPDLVLEIGAHAAGFSRNIKSRLPSACVIAVEANPSVYKRFARTVEEGNVIFLNQAISDQDGELAISVPLMAEGRENATMGSIIPISSPTVKSVNTYTVKASRLDTLVKNNAPRNYGSNILWIDVEGAVRHVLAGAAETLSRCAALYVETESRFRNS